MLRKRGLRSRTELARAIADEPPATEAYGYERATASAGSARPSDDSIDALIANRRATLRAALNLAVKEGILDCNPARHIEIRGYQPPHAKV